MNAKVKHTCRLCYYETVDTEYIFSENGIAFDYTGKINRFLYLSVSLHDDLPKTVCWMCTQHLDTFYRFYEKINQIQQSTLANSYEEFLLQPPAPDESTPKSKSSATILESDTYEIEVLSAASDAENDEDNDVEQFELLEVIGTDGNITSDISAHPQHIDDANNKDILLNALNITADYSSPSDNNKTNSNLDYVRRSVRISRKSIKLKQSESSRIPNDIEKEFNQMCADVDELQCRIATTEYEVDESDDVNDYDQLVADASESNEWPAQGTFDDFPNQIIKDGLLQIKGEKMMSLICRFYHMNCKICPMQQRFESLEYLFEHYQKIHREAGYVECCQTKLVRYQAIMMHMARHLQPDAFKCDECGYIVTKPKSLQSHKQTHLPDNEKPFKCNVCGRRFCWKNALRVHAMTHQPNGERRQYNCHICNRKYDTPGGLWTHKKMAHSGTKRPDSVICHICAKSYATQTGLQEHMATIHQPREKSQIRCNECGKWLMNIRCYKTHMLLHSDIELQCDQCNYKTKKKELLNRHRITKHSTEKPFACHLCGRAFKVKRSLTIHIAQHNTTSIFKCTFCDREFNSSTNYYSHRKHSHPVELAQLKQREEEERRQRRIKAGIEQH